MDNGDYQTAIQEIVDYITIRYYLSEGSGTKEDPFILRSKAQLPFIRHYLDAYFRLEEDIDYTGDIWEIIGTRETPFTGHIDGNGHVISNIRIQGNGTLDGSPSGFFGVMHGGSIRNLTIHHINITGSDYVGSLVGYAIGNTCITRCSIEEGDIKGTGFVGGICGYMEEGTIEASSAAVSVYGKIHVGGIAGYLRGTLLKNCETIATVTGMEKLGGLIGNCIETRVETCISFATLVGNHIVGGLIGYYDGTDIIGLPFKPMVTDCSSFATVKGEHLADGLIGLQENAVMENCLDCSTTEWAKEEKS